MVSCVTDNSGQIYRTDLSRFLIFIYRIYGGLIINEDQLNKISDFIIGLRVKYGFRDEDDFKFHTRARPTHISHKVLLP